MLLERLAEHAERLDLPPPMYRSVAVRWLIDLDESGNLRGFVPLISSDTRSGRDRGKPMLVPDLIRASAIRPKLLADNGEYVLGVARDPKKLARVDKAHASFRRLVDECANATGEPLVLAVQNFLDAWTGGREELPDDFNAEDVLTFRIGEQLPVDLPSVRAFWADYTADATAGPVMHCLVCGDAKPVQFNLPTKIRGIPEGQTAGTALVSANTNAFESYSLERALISPICRDCAEKFGNAANALISDSDSRVYVGKVVHLFWNRSDDPFSPVPFLQAPDPKDALQLVEDMRAVEQDVKQSLQERQGSAAVKRSIGTVMAGGDPGLDLLAADAFYATGFSASGGRVVVRDWLETTVSAVKRNLARWFTLQKLGNRDSTTGNPYGVFALVASLYRDAREIPARLPPLLIGAALHGRQLPDSLLALAVVRNRAEQGITRARATLIKMIFASQGGDEMAEKLVALNPDHPDPAYHCGRLLSELEELQRNAIPGVKATISDRYFGAASSAPASVFGRLIQGSRAHLAKLRKGEASYASSVAIEKRVGEILARIEDEFPAVLDFRRQALFALGYYHQRESNMGRARARQNESRVDVSENANTEGETK